MLTKSRLFLLLCLLAASAVACTAATGDEPTADDTPMAEMEGEHNQGGSHEEDGHDEHGSHDDSAQGHGGEEKLPNDGALITIVAPTDGQTFAFGQDIIVEVDVENFALGDGEGDGNHWHVFVDDASYGMVVGGDRDSVLRNLSPGTHVIYVVLATDEHVELAEGDTVTVVVE